MTQQHTAERAGSTGRWKKLAVLAVFVVVAAGAYFAFGDKLSLDYLAGRESALRQFQDEHPLLVYGLAFAIYVGVTGLSLPGAIPMTMLFAWYFGFWRALVLVSFASTTGATLAFLLSRYLLRDFMQTRFGERLERFNQALERDGAFYLFTLRLIPAVPFFVINVVMALTPLRTRTFWWVSQIGMLPGTAVYVFAGSSVPDLQTLAKEGARGVPWPLVITAFVALGLFPLVVKAIVNRRGGKVGAKQPS